MKQSKVKHVHGGCTGPRMQTHRILGSLLGFDVIENHVTINEKILPVINDKIIATNIQTQTQHSFTSDKTDISEINDNLHTREEFSDLFFEIEKSLGIFFGNLKHVGVDYFITKSWATYTEKNKFIATHEHVASQFSFVYYVQINEDHSPLTFYENKNRFYLPDSSEWNEDNFQSMSYACTPGMLIVFPSHTYHGTQKVNKTDVPRISISGDIIITAKPGVVTEHLIPHPSTWRAI